jgi:hypothetical protein
VLSAVGLLYKVAVVRAVGLYGGRTYFFEGVALGGLHAPCWPQSLWRLNTVYIKDANVWLHFFDDWIHLI